MDEKLLGMLGLCARARGMAFGAQACETGLRRGRVQLLLLAEGTSANTTQRFESMCHARGVPLLTVGTEAAQRAGKPGAKVMAVTDASFARRMIELYSNNGVKVIE